MVGQMTDQLMRVRQVEEALAAAFRQRGNFEVMTVDGERWVYLTPNSHLFADAGVEQPTAGLWDLAVDLERLLSAEGLIR
ncbi:hypothetical protein SAMN05421512_11726 [Stappia indica]|uniref:Uncharacterized protein n=2 Tax=Stappia indica TaxID=538381 RepID=A0A285TT88_9HYPH|nr:hypothetical protein SAMN05421512_11726 [Stappia indica]